ncbi:type VI secretion system lipoprotein TssJ [Robbsia andropogonis]|uniref:type VI secretion system lipoprotein TssJ n=1 Tax=Robbsia andropogonis TaxID=28092 RepID=UPI003D21B1A8
MAHWGEKRWLRITLGVACAIALGGCAAGVGLIGTAGSAALQAVGIGKPPVPDSQKPPRQITLTLDAGTNLNAGTSKRGVALVVRLYALKDPTSFQQAPFDTFLDPDKEKQVLGQDLIQVREVTLIPGQRYTSTEKVPYEAGAFGVVALFRQPATQRWRLVFDPKKSEKSGILIGMHACAMTVTAGTPIVASGSEAQQSLNMLSMVNCQ